MITKMVGINANGVRIQLSKRRSLLPKDYFGFLITQSSKKDPPDPEDKELEGLGTVPKYLIES